MSRYVQVQSTVTSLSYFLTACENRRCRRKELEALFGNLEHEEKGENNAKKR